MFGIWFKNSLETQELDQRLVVLHRTVNARRPIEASCLHDRRYELIWSSAAIEGSTLTLAETELVVRRLLTIENKSIEDAMGALDGAKALEYVTQLLLEQKDGPPLISEQQLLRLHAILLHRTLTEVSRGEYRHHEVRVTGSPFVFPLPGEVATLMADFLAWLNAQPLTDPLSAIIIAAETHLRFVTIHPFEDGNGRMSRLLMNLSHRSSFNRRAASCITPL